MDTFSINYLNALSNVTQCYKMAEFLISFAHIAENRTLTVLYNQYYTHKMV